MALDDVLNGKLWVHEFLDLEKSAGIKVKNEHYVIVDEILADAKNNPFLNSLKSKQKITIDDVAQFGLEVDNIFKKKGFEYAPNRVFSKALENKGICCKDFTSIYLSIGQMFNFPITASTSVNHIFPRWIFDDGTHANIEASYGGVLKDDQHFIDRPDNPQKKIHPDSLKQNVYLRSFSDEEIYASYLIIAGVLSSDLDKGISLFNEAIKLDPLQDGYGERAANYFFKKDYQSSLLDINKYLELDPSSLNHNLLKFKICYVSNDMVKSKESLDKCIDINSLNEDVNYFRKHLLPIIGTNLFEENKLDMAKDCYNKAFNIKIETDDLASIYRQVKDSLKSE